MKARFFFTAVCALLPAVVMSALPAGRQSISLNNSSWSITLDKNASWQNDTLYLPPVDLSALDVNIPSGGWSLLEKPDVAGVHLPATVEEYLWGWNSETFGVNGNYVGVSWFETRFNVPSDWEGKRVTIAFEAVRFRAEVFVNHRLAGYDIINCTPFDVDVSDFLDYGAENTLSVRITDPNGNFNWKDSQVYSWGEYLTNPSHGFGGICGDVSVICTPKTHIDDVFVRNRKDLRKVDVLLSLNADKSCKALPIEYELIDPDGKIVYRKAFTADLSEGENTIERTISLPSAKLWSVDDPFLYTLRVVAGQDCISKRFGFRWFEVRDVDSDRQFYLNGKRIVLRTSISWSFWPRNGLMPSDSLALRQVRAAKELGLNMLNFHRAIGQSNVLDCADSLGLLYWEEPGGNQFPASRFDDDNLQSRFYFAYRNEKLRRMVVRDRSHPSLVIYNMHNERGAAPQKQDYEQMSMAHALDPSRILVYNSSNGVNPEGVEQDRFKTHLMPYDTTFRAIGWWDNHHAGGPGVYHDALYKSSSDYLRGSSNKGEIVFWGEEGAIGTPPRLQLIREEILSDGCLSSWEAQDYLNWYDAYDKFLRTRGFSEAFPCVDSLTVAMGNVAYYYQGRIIENIRINNTVDGYAVNGWESMKLEDHSGIVDNYRNHKGNPSLISRYNEKLVLSVKLNHKVLPAGKSSAADIFIINETGLKGTFELDLILKSPDGKSRIVASDRKVKLSGGDVYGEHLCGPFEIEIPDSGYSVVEAILKKGGKTVCKGRDEIFAVALDATGVSSGIVVADSKGDLAAFLHSMGIQTSGYSSGTPAGDCLLVGAFEPQQWGSGMSDIMEWVYKGHKLVIVDNTEQWAEFLADKETLDYRGSKKIGTAWYGGNFFNRKDKLWTGLPSDCVFNWEYQCFATYDRRRVGLRCENSEILAAAVADHKKEVYSVLSRIRAGRGEILLTTLDIPACLSGVGSAEQSKSASDLEDGMYEASGTFSQSPDNWANVVGQQLLLNMLKP